MIAGILEIQIMANIARLLDDMRRAERLVGDSMGKVERSVASAKRAMSTLGMGLSIGLLADQMRRAVDTYTKVDAQLRLSTKSQQQYNQALADVRRISSVAQSDLSATTMLYTRLMNVMDGTGVSQSKLATVTETISFGLKAYGATAAEAASASLQLSQAMGANRLGGEEFRAVMEAMPNVMKVLADSMGVPLGELRALSIAGKITAAEMVKAFGDPAVAAEFKRMAEGAQTVTGAWVVARNELMLLLGEFGKSSGLTGAAIASFNMLAESFRLIGQYVGDLVVAFGIWAAIMGGKLVASLVAARADMILLNAAHAEALALNVAIARQEAANALAARDVAAARAWQTGATNATTAANARYATSLAEVAAAEKLQLANTTSFRSKILGTVGKAGIWGIILFGIYEMADAMGLMDTLFASAEERAAKLRGNLEGRNLDVEIAALEKQIAAQKELEKSRSGPMGHIVGAFETSSGASSIALAAQLDGLKKLRAEQEVLAAERVKQDNALRAKGKELTEAEKEERQKAADFVLDYETDMIVKRAAAEQDWADYVLAYQTDQILERWKLEQDQLAAFKVGVAGAFDGLLAPGTNVMDQLAKNFGDAVNKSINEALSNVSTNVATGKTSETSTGDWVMLIIGIVASIVSSQTASAEEIAAVTASEVQKRQGAGTVLGAAEEQSASILDSLEMLNKSTFAMSDHTYSMMHSLKSVESSMHAFINVLAQALGGNIAANLGVGNRTGEQTMWGSRSSELTSWLEGRPAGSPLASSPGGQNMARMADIFSKAVWGEVKTAVTDTGLLISGQLSNLQIGQYAAGTKSTTGLFGTGLGASTDTWMKAGAASPALISALNFVYSSIADTFRAVGQTLDVEAETINATFANFTTTIGKLSLHGLSAEDQVKALNNAISKDADLLAAQLFPAMMQFQQAGEGMLETLTRLVLEISTLDNWYAILGKTVVSTTASADAFVASLGGVERASEMMGRFVKNFAPAVDQAAHAGRQLAAAGLPLLNTTQEWWDFAKTASEAQTVALLENQDAIGSWIAQMDAASKKLTEFLKQDAFKTMVDYRIAMDRARAMGTATTASAVGTPAGLTIDKAADIANAAAAASAVRKAAADAKLMELNALIASRPVGGTVAGSIRIDMWRREVAKMQSEYDAMPKFANGANYLPNDMIAQVHEGERIIPKADNMQLMQQLRNPNAANDVLVAEVRGLRNQIAKLEIYIASIDSSNSKMSILAQKDDEIGIPETRLA